MKKIKAIKSMTQGNAWKAVKFHSNVKMWQFFTHLEGLHESPKQSSDVLVLVQQLDQSRHTEESEERDGHHLLDLLLTSYEDFQKKVSKYF